MSVHGDDDAHNGLNALNNLPPALPARPNRVERPTSSIAVDKFRSGVDDFEEYGEILERGIKVATNVRDATELGLLCKDWLPLKLDAPALAVLRQANVAADWKDLKEELIALLVDPQEKYKWQARLTTIKWDQKESFHALASRVRRAVNKFDKDMPQEFKEREYYQRFCDALPKYYRSAIHMGCAPTERNIENAKELALRAQIACAEPNGESKSVTFEDTGFAAASMDDPSGGDRVSGVERSLAAILTTVEGIAAGQRRLEDRIVALEERNRIEDQARNSRSRYQNSSGRQSPSGYGSPGYQSPSGNRDYRNQNRGYSPSNDRQQNQQNRDNRDNRDSRNYRGDGASGGYQRGQSPNQNQSNGSRNQDGNRNRSSNNARRSNNDRRDNRDSNGNRSNNQRDGGGRSENYRAIQTEDEDSDPGVNSDEAEALCAMMAEQMLRAKSRSKRSGN